MVGQDERECTCPNYAVGAKRPSQSEQVLWKFIAPYQSCLELARPHTLEWCLAATDGTVILASIPASFSNCWDIIPPPLEEVAHI